MAPEAEPRYVPAARWRVFTRLYDPVLALTMRERQLRGEMMRRVEADLPAQGTLVDIGCGTGTFALALGKRRPDARLVGIDGDEEVLALARSKPGASRIRWQKGLAQGLPMPSGSADVATTSLVLHHLLPEDKRKALAEAKRILKPGGHLHVADWGRPSDPLMSGVFFVSQAIDGFDRTADHRAGRLPAFIEAASFEAVERYGRFRTAFGVVELLRAPSSSEESRSPGS